MDTRYWGPSGWQLFHLIAFRSQNSEEILRHMHEILPCKFCRESTTQFVTEHPLKDHPAVWLYDIHNLVNNKLRTQCKDDPNVINPGENPSFEEVKSYYLKLKPTEIPGRDFLFSIAVNYPDKPEESDIVKQRVFIEKLSVLFPFHSFQRYLKEHPVTLQNKKAYMKWMYGLFQFLAPKFHTTLPSFKGYVMRGMYYKSGCEKKTYRGKTCRKTPSGTYTKSRDNRKTQKVAHSTLLRLG